MQVCLRSHPVRAVTVGLKVLHLRLIQFILILETTAYHYLHLILLSYLLTLIWIPQQTLLQMEDV